MIKQLFNSNWIRKNY